MATEDFTSHADMLMLDWMVPVVLIVLALPFGLLMGALLADAIHRRTASAFAAFGAAAAVSGTLLALLLWALPGEPILTARTTATIAAAIALVGLLIGCIAERRSNSTHSPNMEGAQDHG